MVVYVEVVVHDVIVYSGGDRDGDRDVVMYDEGDGDCVTRLCLVYCILLYKLWRARHRVAFHWLSQPIRALFARSRPIMFKRP